MATIEIPTTRFIVVNGTFNVSNDAEVKVYREEERIKIGEEIPTSMKVIDCGGNIVDIPLCFNCLKHPAVKDCLCCICHEFEEIEDYAIKVIEEIEEYNSSFDAYCENDLIETNPYTQEQK
jgi:hypothetical protein